jgi:hypothetical protein
MPPFESSRDNDHPRLAEFDAAIASACHVRFEASERLRLEIEARLLAGQPTGEIAERTGLPAETIEAYEALFFCVSDKLECTDWIVTMVFGPRLHTGYTEANIDIIWRLYGWQLGPAVVDCLVDFVYPDPARGPTPTGTADDQELAKRLRREIALRTIPITEKTAPRILQLTQRVSEIQKEAEGTSVATISGPVRMDISEISPANNIPVDSAVPDLAALSVSQDDGGNGIEVDGVDADRLRQIGRKRIETEIDQFLADVRKLA